MQAFRVQCITNGVHITNKYVLLLQVSLYVSFRVQCITNGVHITNKYVLLLQVSLYASL